MTIVVPNVSDILMLQYIVNMIGQDGNTAPSGGQRCLHLYTNNLTPGKTTVLTDFTEASGSVGYAPITLAGSSWTTVSSAGTNMAVYSAQTFPFTTTVTIYGYYVTTIEISPQLLWAERFPLGPYAYPSDGGQLNVTPEISLN